MPEAEGKKPEELWVNITAEEADTLVEMHKNELETGGDEGFSGIAHRAERIRIFAEFLAKIEDAK